MPFLNKNERELVKNVLSQVLDDADIKTQFEKASRAAKSTPNDHLSGQLAQYAGMLKEISDDRLQRRKKPPRSQITRPGPDIAALRKKFGIKP